MNLEQVKGVIERVITIVVAWAIGKGYIPESIGGDFTTFLVMAVSLAWAWKVNTPASLEAATKAVAPQ